MEHTRKRSHEYVSAKRDYQTSELNSHDLGSRVREVKRWINAPNFMESYERAEQARCLDTGSWVTLNPTYLAWRDDETASRRHRNGENMEDFEFASRVLIFEGEDY
jgi:hypothetical protein